MMKVGDLVRISSMDDEIGKIRYTTNEKDVYIVSFHGDSYIFHECELKPLSELEIKMENARDFLETIENVDDSDYARGYLKGATDMLERFE